MEPAVSSSTAILTRHHPASAHRRQLGLFLQVLELRVARLVHARVLGMSTSALTATALAAFPFAIRIVSAIEDRSEISMPRWVRHGHVREAGKSRRDDVHLVDGV
jgi:hypothetical protein